VGYCSRYKSRFYFLLLIILFSNNGKFFFRFFTTHNPTHSLFNINRTIFCESIIRKCNSSSCFSSISFYHKDFALTKKRKMEIIIKKSNPILYRLFTYSILVCIPLPGYSNCTWINFSNFNYFYNSSSKFGI
jgi:hypothetical protein